MPPAGAPFDPGPHPLAGGGLLRPLTAGETRALGSACAATDPYRTLGLGAGALAAFLARGEDGVFRYALEMNGALAGALVIRWPWLRGPFIDMLTILPPFQGAGLGHAAVAWTALAAAGAAANLWTTVSDFNAPARAFWAAQGFAETADLSDLISDGYSELLLRRRLDRH